MTAFCALLCLHLTLLTVSCGTMAGQYLFTGCNPSIFNKNMHCYLLILRCLRPNSTYHSLPFRGLTIRSMLVNQRQRSSISQSFGHQPSSKRICSDNCCAGPHPVLQASCATTIWDRTRRRAFCNVPRLNLSAPRLSLGKNDVRLSGQRTWLMMAPTH